MAISCENIFKYIKLILVHPALEIGIEIFYLLTAVVIAVFLFRESSQYDEYQILEMTESYLNYNDFNSIKTTTEFKSYLVWLLDKLYTLDPSNQEIPLFIPLSPIRLSYFQKENECNDEIDYTKTCINDMHKFRCVIDNMINNYKYRCGEKYSEDFEFLTKKLKGYYSYYNLRNSNDHIDITKKSYISEDQDNIAEIIDNKRLKAIILQINLKAPSNNNYIDAILGIEMTNYFTNLKTIFSVYIINEDRPSTNIFLKISLIFLIISVFLSTMKLIYEMNVKCIYSIHILLLLVKLFDIIFIIACITYLVEDKNLKFQINLRKFESHIKYINILWLLKLFFAIMALFFPFRLLALLSWLKTIAELFIALMNIFFRMLPGLIISFISIIFFIFIFSVINYFLFNDMYPYYETLYKSFISSFNIHIISTLYKTKEPSRIFNNLFLSKYSIIFIYFQIVFFFFIVSIFIATLAYMFKNAILFQEPEDDNNYLEKLKEIENKLREKKENENMNNQINELHKKQILWFSLDKEKNEIRNEIQNEIDNDKNEVLFFKNSNQIISFIKYIFTIKPYLQHIKLRHKLNIVIETNQRFLESNERKELNKLTDWLIFIECKIPLIIYGSTRFDPSYIIKLKSLYKCTIFINNKKELEKILKDTGEKVISISYTENFTLGK